MTTFGQIQMIPKVTFIVHKGTGNVWARANSRVADTDTFTDQLALTGKFNTGRLKHSFNLGAEYSDQETDRTQYIINGENTTGCNIIT